MAIPFTGTFNLLGEGFAGGAVAQALTAAGVATGDPITTGIVDLGQGKYLFSGSVPDDARHVSLANTTAGRRDVIPVGANVTHVLGVTATGTSIDGTGRGARTVTITVNDGAAAIQNARVRLTEGVNSYVGSTNASGQIVFNLNDATYTVAVAKDNYLFAGTTLVVDGNEAVTYSMTAQTIPAAANPAQTTAYLTTRDGKGAAQANVTVYFRLVNPDGTVDAYERGNFTATSDANGLLQVALKQSSIYEGRLGTRGDWTRFTTGSAATYALPEILGSYGS